MLSSLQISKYLFEGGISVNYHFIFSFISSFMKKVLAVATVAFEHRELVFKELKKIFRKIKISLDTLLQEEICQSKLAPENGNVFSSYPYITLTVPNYEINREYLEKIIKNNVLFDKFILLISEGKNYDELANNRNQEVLREHCRNWNTPVSCSFDSSPLFTAVEDQVSKIDLVMGELDIRGKITEIDAKKKFHLIQDHMKDDQHDPSVPDTPVPTKTTLLKLFFGLEVGCGRKAICGGAYAVNNYYNYNNAEFMDLEEDEKMIDEDEETKDIDSWQQQKQIIWGSSSRRRSGDSSSHKKAVNKRQAKSRFQKPLAPLQNPYLKKDFPCEVNCHLTA